MSSLYLVNSFTDIMVVYGENTCCKITGEFWSLEKIERKVKYAHRMQISDTFSGTILSVTNPTMLCCTVLDLCFCSEGLLEK